MIIQENRLLVDTSEPITNVVRVKNLFHVSCPDSRRKRRWNLFTL